MVWHDLLANTIQYPIILVEGIRSASTAADIVCVAITLTLLSLTALAQMRGGTAAGVSLSILSLIVWYFTWRIPSTPETVRMTFFTPYGLPWALVSGALSGGGMSREEAEAYLQLYRVAAEAGSVAVLAALATALL